MSNISLKLGGLHKELEILQNHENAIKERIAKVKSAIKELQSLDKSQTKMFS